MDSNSTHFLRTQNKMQRIIDVSMLQTTETGKEKCFKKIGLKFTNNQPLVTPLVRLTNFEPWLQSPYEILHAELLGRYLTVITTSKTKCISSS